jgi:hypothetical protein
MPMDVSKVAGFEDVKPPLDSWQSTLKPRLLKAIERLIAEY